MILITGDTENRSSNLELKAAESIKKEMILLNGWRIKMSYKISYYRY